MDLYHFLFKYIIVGDSNVGKSCLLLNYTEKRFVEEHDATIGVEFGSTLFKYKDKTIKIQIWDTAGQESFRSITRSYYKGSIGVILAFDLTKPESFYNLHKWKTEVLQCTHDNIELVLVGNKMDLEEERQVSTHEASNFAEQNEMSYMETSAKTGQNVDKVFETMAESIMNKIESKEIDFFDEHSGIKIGTFFKINEDVKEEAQENKKSGCC